MVFALTGAASLRTRAAAAFGEEHAIFDGVTRFGTDLRRYLVVRAQLGLFAAVLVFIMLLVLKVPLPALWAFLTFAAAFIPTIGPIALVPPTILALLETGPATALLVVAGYMLINVAQDYLLQPRMMGTELNLTALVVFLSVVGPESWRLRCAAGRAPDRGTGGHPGCVAIHAGHRCPDARPRRHAAGTRRYARR